VRLCIFGAGAVGGNFAARLARAGVDVTVIARGPHLEAIRSRGLTVLAGEERIHAKPFATDDPARAGIQDAVLVTLKAHALPGAVPLLAPLLGPDTPVVFAANGVPWWYFHGLAGPHGERRLPRLDPDGSLWDGLPIARAVGGIIYSANEVVSPGVVRNNSPARNRLVLGEPRGGTSARLEAIAAVLGPAGIDAPVVADIRPTVWSKLLGNLAFSPVSALAATTTDMIGTDPGLRALCARLMDEGAAVATALGIPADALGERLGPPDRPRPAHKTSMLQDFEAGRTPELDAIVLVVQDLAGMLGIATPTLDAVAALAVARARALGLYGP